MLVINEWLFHDIKGENGQSKRQETVAFLTQFAQSQDKIAVLYDSPWTQKAKGLMRQNDLTIKPVSKLLWSLIMDLSKCRILQPDDIEAAAVPADAIDAAPDEDIYLIQTYYAAYADLLITTDEGLHNAFASRQDVKVIFRNDFLNDNLNS